MAGLSFFVIGFLARLPFSMSVVGVMTAVATVRGSLTEAGATAAVVGLGSAVVGPLVGMLADRHGQRRVLLISGITNTAGLLLLVAVLVADGPTAAVLGSGFLIGASAPQVSPMIRVRWLAMIPTRFSGVDERKAVQAALSYESMADELVFVFGPVFVGLFAVAFRPEAPLVAAALLTIVFVTAFALHRTVAYTSGRDPADTATRTQVSPASDLFTLRVALPVAGMLSIGLFFGSTLTSLTSFMGEIGDAERTGLAYGVMGVSSAILALGVVLLPERFSLTRRWLVFASVALVGSLLLGFADTMPWVLAVLLVMGCGIGPSLVTLFGIASRVAPRGRTTTVMAAMSSAIIVGQSAASATVGTIVDAQGHSAGFVAVTVSTALLLAFGLVFVFVARGIPRRSDPVD